MTLLTLDHLEQIYQTLKNQYAHCHESKVIVCFYDSRCFFFALHTRSVKNLKI